MALFKSLIYSVKQLFIGIRTEIVSESLALTFTLLSGTDSSFFTLFRGKNTISKPGKVWWHTKINTYCEWHNFCGVQIFLGFRGGSFPWSPLPMKEIFCMIYTNGKKKQCIAKMLIAHKLCSGWAWKFINMVCPIHVFNCQTFTRFHVRLVHHLFFLWKLHFMSSATEKQHAIKLIDANVSLWSLGFENHYTFVN